MNGDSRQLRYLRRRIPGFACQPGCHDCCGPVTASSEELSRLPSCSEKDRAAALAEWSCPHLGPAGCRVYEERPLICRLFGTTPQLTCPNGCRPAEMTERGVERQILRYIAGTPQRLV